MVLKSVKIKFKHFQQMFLVVTFAKWSPKTPRQHHKIKWTMLCVPWVKQPRQFLQNIFSQSWNVVTVTCDSTPSLLINCLVHFKGRVMAHLLKDPYICHQDLLYNTMSSPAQVIYEASLTFVKWPTRWVWPVCAITLNTSTRRLHLFYLIFFEQQWMVCIIMCKICFWIAKNVCLDPFVISRPWFFNSQMSQREGKPPAPPATRFICAPSSNVEGATESLLAESVQLR